MERSGLPYVSHRYFLKYKIRCGHDQNGEFWPEKLTRLGSKGCPLNGEP